MESHINQKIDAIKAEGKEVVDIKIIGESLGRAAVFVCVR